MTDLPQAAAVIGIAAHQRGHVERDAEPTAARGQDHLVALVGLLGVPKAGELSDGPGTPAIAARIETAGEGELTRPADPLYVRIGILRVGPIHRIDFETRDCGEVGVANLALRLSLGKRSRPTRPAASSVCSHCNLQLNARTS